MRSKKPRPFTEAERREVHALCLRGKLGALGSEGSDRCSALHEINPEEYAEIGAKAREAAVATINPMHRSNKTNEGSDS